MMGRGAYDTSGMSQSFTQIENKTNSLYESLRSTLRALDTIYNLPDGGNKWAKEGSSMIPYSTWSTFRNKLGLCQATRDPQTNTSMAMAIVINTIQWAELTKEQCEAISERLDSLAGTCGWLWDIQVELSIAQTRLKGYKGPSILLGLPGNHDTGSITIIDKSINDILVLLANTTITEKVKKEEDAILEQFYSSEYWDSLILPSGV